MSSFRGIILIKSKFSFATLCAPAVSFKLLVVSLFIGGQISKPCALKAYEDLQLCTSIQIPVRYKYEVEILTLLVIYM